MLLEKSKKYKREKVIVVWNNILHQDIEVFTTPGPMSPYKSMLPYQTDVQMLIVEVKYIQYMFFQELMYL